MSSSALIRAALAAFALSLTLAVPALGASAIPPLGTPEGPAITLVSGSENVVMLSADASGGAVTLTAWNATMTVTCGGSGCAGVAGQGTSSVTLPAAGDLANVTVTLSPSGAGVPSLTARQGGSTATVSVSTTANSFNGAFSPAPSSTLSLLPWGGLGLFVFGGGRLDDLAQVTGCPAERLAVWTTDRAGGFLIFIPGSVVDVVNQAFRSFFPDGVIPAHTPMIGRCE